MKRYVQPLLAGSLLFLVAVLVLGVSRYRSFRPAAITLGPETTIYFDDDPSLATRVHEAIHRRQMREKSLPGRLWSALRYNFDYGYRLDEEAEAKAGELCLQIHRFSSELPSYTTARSRRQAETYRTWAWERMGIEVPDRVGRYLEGGARCSEILRGVVLDLPPETRLSESDGLKMATFGFLQSVGSSRKEVEQWRARLDLAGYAEPAPWEFVGQRLPFHLIPVARAVAVAPDTTITAREAGEALHRLTYYEAERIPVKLRQPRAFYSGRPLIEGGEAENVLDVPVAEWSTGLLERALDGKLDEEQIEWLARMAGHRVHRDFERFARARGADVIETRYRRTPEDDGTWIGLLLTDLEPIEEVFRAQWGRAALAVARGELEAAASVMRTLVAGSLQFVESAPFEADAVLGLELMEEALLGLARLEEIRRAARLEADGDEDSGEVGDEALGVDEDGDLEVAGDSEETGDAGEAGDAQESDDTVSDGVPERISPRDFWGERHRRALFSDDPVLIYLTLPEIAGDSLIPYAFRRFAYRQVVLYDVCLERAARTWRERRAHREWREAVDEGLVRRESDRWFIGLLRDRVAELLDRSAVPLDEICDPSTIRRPGARIAIMTAVPDTAILSED